MKITKGKLRSIIQEEFTRVLSEQDNKDVKEAKAAARLAVTTVKDMWRFVTNKAGGEKEAIKLFTRATDHASSGLGRAILKMFKEGEGQIQEGLVDFFTGSTINTLREMGKKLVRYLGTMADAEGNRGDGRHNERMEIALNAVLEQSGMPENAQSAIRVLITSVGNI